MHRAFTVFVVVLGGALLFAGALPWQTFDPIRCYFFLVLSLLAVFGRINMPQVAGTLSVSFVFVLVSIMELSLSEALLVGCISTAVQAALQHRSATGTASPLFHVGSAAISITIAYRAFHAAAAVASVSQGTFLSLLIAASILYAMNALPVAVWLSLSKRRNLALVFRECNFRMFPFYLGGAVLAGLFHFSNELLGGQSPLLLLPVAVLFYLTYRSYSVRSGVSIQPGGQNELADLYMRTLEALAMSIEARDMEAHNHLRRMQLYAVEVGRKLGLPEPDLEALRVAAVLHDIGKLAVPEHILSKPGQLTREEFDKVKIHPTVGAEILNRVRFPAPVSAIVRSHHERWNGAGYPDGLKMEEIPMGARILAAVDCLDALITGRPYRPAMTLHQAISRLAAESGISFDPKVVKVVEDLHMELEAQLQQTRAVAAAQREEVADALMVKPAKQNPAHVEADPGGGLGYLDSIAAARNEAQFLLELTQLLGDSVQLDETLAKVSMRLRRIVPFDSMVVYVVKESTRLAPRYATGECTSLFLSREIPLGHGITGWVSVHKKPILNGNPSVETGVGTEPGRTVVLNSALAVPLPGNAPNAGVILLGRRGFDAFGKDDLRMVQAVSAKLGSVIDSSIKYEQAAASASTDFLTGLPNARALNLQLEAEIARCRRHGGPLAVLVTDLDGFKDVNDRFGHLAGNDVLKAVGRVLRENCREYDYVSRMGGDEFVILLPGMEEADVMAKIEAFNRAVGEAGRKVVPDSKLGLSIGQARFPADGATPEQLLAEADQRMYQAKTIRKMRQHRGAPRGYDFDWLETSPK